MGYSFASSSSSSFGALDELLRFLFLYLFLFLFPYLKSYGSSFFCSPSSASASSSSSSNLPPSTSSSQIVHRRKYGVSSSSSTPPPSGPLAAAAAASSSLSSTPPPSAPPSPADAASASASSSTSPSSNPPPSAPPPPPADVASASGSSSSPSSSSTRIVQLKRYGVFLSFRGADVRDKFVSHLYTALCKQGTLTFLDNEELERGKPISEILEAISESNIAVVVFSQNYADSTFCLKELMEIMECKETQGLVVLPIFYEVNPVDVASQTGCFEKAFAKLVNGNNEETVRKWKTAMREAAKLCGWDSRNFRLESTLIEEIVNYISRKLGYGRCNNFKGLVGIDSQIETVENLLDVHSNDTRVVGIWGMGGIGKTTLAKCVFERNVMHFQGSCCFLSGVREESQTPRGLQQLQCDLLDKVFGIRNATMTQLRHRKVFIVLDDVDTYTQFESLIGGRDWIAEGSKIIITSRDKSVLDNVVDIGYMFKVPALVVQDALRLFISFAFKGISPGSDHDYVELSNSVVSYAKGNPLALKVLGLFLHNKSKAEWKSALEQLKLTMNKDIREVLRISYDGLEDAQKEIFLHISCFFKGKPESDVKEILDACSFCTSIGLRVLIDKALIERWDNKIEMHDLLQEMGQEIVRQECVNDPGKRSRLWNHTEISRVFTKNSGTGAIRGLFFDVSAISGLSLTPTAFAKTDQVELLKFYGYVDKYEEYFPPFLESQFEHLQLPEGLESLPSSLKYLYWECYPLESLSSNFCPENLAIIDMPCSKFKRLWIGEQNLVNLKVIRLRRCRNLIEMPNLSSAHNLVTIDCSYCESLLEVPPSISCLGKLEKLDFRYCSEIRSFPSTTRLGSLESLLLGGCLALSTFPEVSTNIKDLVLTRTAIQEVPESIKSLCQLQSLDLRDCERLRNLPAAVSELISLGLHIGPSFNAENLNTTLSSLPLLSSLTLTGDSFDALPTSITELSGLEVLLLFTCTGLQSLPNLPPCIYVIFARDCTSLQTVPRLSFEIAEGCKRRPQYNFFFVNCPSLDRSSRRNIQKYWQQAVLHVANAVNRHPDHQRLSMRDEVFAICPGSEIPRWFTTENRGYSIDIDLPSGWHNENFLGFSLCAVIGQRSQEGDNDDHLQITWKCQFGSNHGDSAEAYETFITWLWLLESQHVFTFYSSHFHRILTTDSSNQWSGNYYNKASFEVFRTDYSERSPFEVESCAVRLLYAGNDKDDSHSMV